MCQFILVQAIYCIFGNISVHDIIAHLYWRMSPYFIQHATIVKLSSRAFQWCYFIQHRSCLGCAFPRALLYGKHPRFFVIFSCCYYFQVYSIFRAIRCDIQHYCTWKTQYQYISKQPSMLFRYFCLGALLIFVGSVLLCALGFTIVLPHEATRDWPNTTCQVINSSYDNDHCSCDKHPAEWDQCVYKYPCLQVGSHKSVQS